VGWTGRGKSERSEKADETVRGCAWLATIKKIKRTGETPALRKADLAA
jgi:hypothetical protein